MEKDEKFLMYFNDVARNVPDEVLKYLVNLFMIEASMNMRNDFEERDLERVIYFIKSEFNHIQISLLASAFVRGSLGKFGAGRLIPRVIYGWLNEVNIEYSKKLQHEEVEAQFRKGGPIMDLISCPAGKAICKKIDWYNAKAIDDRTWDKIDLMKLAEDLASGKHVTTLDYL